ncbi:MAG: hypothetical protein ABSF66_02470 [Terriglobales bacterium]
MKRSLETWAAPGEIVFLFYAATGMEANGAAGLVEVQFEIHWGSARIGTQGELFDAGIF